MTRSSRFFSVLAVACLAAASAFSAAADRVVGAVRTGFGFLIGAWVDPLADKPKTRARRSRAWRW